MLLWYLIICNLWARQLITEVFLEEYGHYLDNKLNQQDRAGDEGEYFATVVTGKTLSLSDITRLQTEDDKVVVTLAGQAVQIEQSTLPVILVGTTPSNANENNTPGGFILTRSGDFSSSLTVNYAISGTAINGTDYSNLSGTVTFTPGNATATVVVNPLDDGLYEGTETVTLTLVSGTTYIADPDDDITATLSIADNELLVVNQLTFLAYNDYSPQISGNKVVWKGYDGTDDEIFFYNGTSTIQLTNNSYNEYDAHISGNNVVWYSYDGNDNEIYRFTATTVLGSDTIQETATGGIDTIDFTGTTAAATLNLGLTTIQTVVTTNLSLTLSANNVIENVIGGNGADNFTGNVLDNSLTGGLGNDNLRGGDGADSLTGSAGNDILAGNAGNDKLIYSSGKVFTTTDIGLDTILDFTVGSDKIVLSKATFKSLLSVAGNGFSQAAEFAVVADDSFVDTQAAFIVYSSGSGNLFYNQNGITAGLGTGAAFANLFNIPATLTAGDFAVVV